MHGVDLLPRPAWIAAERDAVPLPYDAKLLLRRAAALGGVGRGGCWSHCDWRMGKRLGCISRDEVGSWGGVPMWKDANGRQPRGADVNISLPSPGQEAKGLLWG